MKAPPIPSFEPYSCPNCGLPMREPVEFCPACGARIEQPNRTPSWVRVLMIVVLSLFMVPFGLSGACFLIVGAVSSVSAFDSPGNIGEILMFGAIGLVLFGIAVLCALGIRKLGRK